MKRILKILLILPSLALLYILAAAVSAWWTLPAIESDAPTPHTVYLVSNGVHMNLALPAADAFADWPAFLPDAELAGGRYVLIGWGSRAFYTQVPAWSDLRPGIALRALLFDRSALRVDALAAPPPADYPLLRRLHLSDAQYARLIADIQAQFAARKALLGHPGFYPAHGRYTPLLTCNEWMRRRLRHIGLPTPLWSPFDRPLLWKF